jgi:hypothetical protein
MRDPIDNFFDTDREESAYIESEISAEPMGAIEEAAISEDVQLVRETLRKAIVETSTRLPEFMSLATQMQEPAMVDSASRMLTALSKLASDLINIDLRVLAESKKAAGRTVSQLQENVDVIPGQRVVTEATTADVLRIMREADRASAAGVAEAKEKYGYDEQPAR